ncbi:MAG: hypothetical protein OXC48_05990 [Endozoicomonadaceae bacterium]|nr:hypothetical protein [Endozoicomonadaceae bacterium]
MGITMNYVNRKPAGTQLTSRKRKHPEKLPAIKRRKIDAALATIKAKLMQNPKILQKTLLELNINKIGSGSIDDIEKYVKEVNPNLI